MRARAGKSELLPVAIGEFKQLVSLGLWAVLSGDRQISVVGVDMAFAELVLLASEPHAPEVVVLDAARVEGRTLRRLHELAPQMGIVTLVESSSRASTPTLISEGAANCLPIDARPAEILQAVWLAAPTSARGGRRPRRHGRSEREDELGAVVSRLTKRQTEVLALLTTGNTRATIALTLGIQESTAHAHIKNVYEKLGVNSRSAVREWAMATASFNGRT